jgi:hypothetical protein
MILMETRSRIEDEPDGLCHTNFTYPETAAILKKNANIFTNKCCQKCNGLYQIN